jgi:hypothetical protein
VSVCRVAAYNSYGSQVFAGSGDRHEGMYHKGHRHGLGTYLWANGDKYVGQFKLGKVNPHGMGAFASVVLWS